MKTSYPKPGDYIMWDGRLAHITGIATTPTAHIEIIDQPFCHCCGSQPHLSVVIGSPQWDEGVGPVKTIQSHDLPAQLAGDRQDFKP